MRVVLISALKVFMKTVLGPFHPHLENALIEDVRKHKSNNPFSPLLILVPSDSLRRRLKICFAAENRVNLLNVYILTFTSSISGSPRKSNPGRAHLWPMTPFSRRP